MFFHPDNVPSYHEHDTPESIHERTVKEMQDRRRYADVKGTTDDQAYAFRDLKRRRDVVIAAMPLAGFEQARIDRLRQCNSATWVFRHDVTGSYGIRRRLCGIRWCPYCQKGFLATLRKDVLSWLPKPRHRLRFLTLTQPAQHGEDLHDAIIRLRRAFTTMRRTDWWRKRIHAGVYVLEITRNPDRQWYHAHLHLLLDSRFIVLEEIHQLWAKATDTPTPGCKISLVRDPAAAGQYLAKYLSKPIPDSLHSSPETLAAVMRALHHRPLMLWFGAWKGQSLTSKIKKSRFNSNTEAANHQMEWTYLGTLQDIINRASDGEHTAQQILVDIGYGKVPVHLWTTAKPTPVAHSPPTLFDQEKRCA